MVEYDAFAIGGQSNAQGKGNSALSPSVPTDIAIEYYRNDTQSSMDDPVGDADTGSAWPAFARQYYQITGRQSCYVELADGGAAQDSTARSSGSWDTDGTLYTEAVDGINSMMAYLNNHGHDPTFKGVLWHQGERDSQSIDNGNTTPDQYETAFREMCDRFQSDVSNFHLYLWTVAYLGSGDTAGFQAVRERQKHVADSRDDVTLVSDYAPNYAEQGLLIDGLHYNQYALNDMGHSGAIGLAGGSHFRGKRGSGIPLSNYVGAPGEVVYDPANETAKLQDGRTEGGVSIGSNSSPSTSGIQSGGVYLASTPTISEGTTETKVPFDALQTPDGGLNSQFDTSTGEFTVPSDGRYLINSQVSYGDSMPDGARIRLGVLNTTTDSWVSRGFSHTGLSAYISVLNSISAPLSSGDVLVAQTTQVNPDATAQTLLSGNQWSYLSIDKLA